MPFGSSKKEKKEKQTKISKRDRAIVDAVSVSLHDMTTAVNRLAEATQVQNDYSNSTDMSDNGDIPDLEEVVPAEPSLVERPLSNPALKEKPRKPKKSQVVGARAVPEAKQPKEITIVDDQVRTVPQRNEKAVMIDHFPPYDKFRAMGDDSVHTLAATEVVAALQDAVARLERTSPEHVPEAKMASQGPSNPLLRPIYDMDNDAKTTISMNKSAVMSTLSEMWNKLRTQLYRFAHNLISSFIPGTIAKVEPILRNLFLVPVTFIKGLSLFLELFGVLDLNIISTILPLVLAVL
jgi:hypothetical protein